MKRLTAPVVFWMLSMVAGGFNWLFNLYAGRSLTKEDFAVLSVFISFGYLLGVPASALNTTVSRYTAYYRQKGADKFYFFFRQYWWLSWAIGLFFFSLFFLLRNYLSVFFGLSSSTIFFLFVPFSLLVFLLAFEFGLLLGQMAFIWVGCLSVIEAAFKFVFLFFSQSLRLPVLASAVFCLSASALFAWLAAVLVGRSFRPARESSQGPFLEMKETYRFLGSSFFTSLGLVLVCSLDVLLVNHFLPAFEAGVYATLSLLGKIMYFGAGGLTSLLVPLTAKAQSQGSFSRRPLWTILGIVVLIGGVILGFFLLFPSWTIRLLLTANGLVVQPYLPKYCLAIFFLTLATCFTTFSLAKKNYFQANLISLAAIVEGIFIALFHQSLAQVVEVVFWTMLGLLVTLAVFEFFGITVRSMLNNWLSFFKLFVPDSPPAKSREKQKILFLNWRDHKHEQAGGAEVYLYEIGKRLVKKGFGVTIFTANDGKNKPREEEEGVEIIRRGGFLTVYFWAAVYWLFRFRRKFDLVIDCENGIPFFSPLYVKKSIILLVHHVHQDVFLKSLLPPFSWLAIFLETKLMPLVYRNCQVICVSGSTAEDLQREVGLKTNEIIYNGIDLSFFSPQEKANTPVIAYLGRLKAYKSIEVLIDAFSLLKNEIPEARLVIAGEGDYREVLERYVKKKEILSVKFLGRVSEEEKVRLLGQSWVVVNPSFKEGWGIVCLEANACGTPVLASRVEGLKEVVSEGESGLLFDYGDSETLYRQMKEIITNVKERKRLSEGARKWSLNFGWEQQADRLASYIFEIIKPAKEAKWLKQALPSGSRF
jgi:glycosyltransferase involved in cell wall biosynthesis/O-antigen/teichoic acid export membrane protein